jgi:hypothetical protein
MSKLDILNRTIVGILLLGFIAFGVMKETHDMCYCGLSIIIILVLKLLNQNKP